MSEAERILAHIEAGHKEVYPFCGECRQSKGAESPAPGHGAGPVKIHSAPFMSAARVNDAPSLSHSQHITD